MAKRRRSRSVLNLTARSETRRGFTMPKISAIKSALRKRSKTFLISIIMSMFSKLSKTAKISMLIKIDRKSIGRKTKRKATRRRRKSTRRKAPKRRKRRTTRKAPKRRKATKRRASKRRTKV